MNVNVLFTSVGRRVELVRAFRRAYQRLGIDGKIVGTDIDPLAPAMHEVDIAALVPSNRDESYVPTIGQLCADQRVDVVFPLIDPDIPRLASERERIESTGARLAVVGPQAAQACGDKWLINKFFDRLGLFAPRSWLPGELVPSEASYPLFVKPRNGSAAMHTFQARDAAELEFFQQYVPNAIIQEFLKGPEVTSDVVCDLDGNVLSIISRRRIAVRGGEVTKAVTVNDEQIDAACRDIAAALPAIGPITVQCMMHDGQPHFIEVNARLGGGIPLAFAAGIDVPAILLSSVAGRSLTALQTDSYTEGLYMTRCDESLYMSKDAFQANLVDYRQRSDAN